MTAEAKGKLIAINMDSPSVQYLSKKDSRLKKLISEIGDITYTLHDEDSFVFLVHEIIEQMLSVKAGQAIFNRLVELCDGEITPEAISDLSDEKIKSIGDLTGADMFKVEPLVPYAKDYNTCIEEAKQRVGNAPIKESISDISAYGTVYIMSPIYWGTYAPEIETAIKGLDFTGKKVRVISTHEGSGLASMVRDVKKNCKGAIVDENGLAIKGSQVKNSKAAIEKWI